MAASYGFDISARRRRAKKPCSGSTSATSPASRNRTAPRCRSAAPRRSSTSTSSATSRRALLTEEQAQEIVDDFVIKLRIVRFLRTPEYDELFAGDPTWVTESIAGMGDDGRPLVTKTSFRFLQTLYNLGPAPEPNLTIWYSPRLPDGFRRFAAKVAIDTSSLQFESDEIMRRAWGDDGAIACCVSPMLHRQADAVLRRARQPRQVPALRDQRRPRRDQRRAGRAAVRSRCRAITSTSTTCSSGSRR